MSCDSVNVSVPKDVVQEVEEFLNLRKGTSSCKVCGFSGDSKALNYEGICLWCHLEDKDGKHREH